MTLTLVTLLLTAAAADVAPPPSSELPPNFSAGAPLNPMILVFDPFVETTLSDAGAAIVPTTNALVSDNNFNSLRRVLPSELLRPQTTYGVDTVDGQGLLSFTTGDAADDVTPGDVSASYANDVLHVEADEAVVVADVRFDGGTSFFAFLDESGDATVFDATGTGGTHSLSIVALDAAGNASAPVEVEADFGFGSSCCAQAPQLPAALALLLLLRRPRRPRPPREIARERTMRR